MYSDILMEVLFGHGFVTDGKAAGSSGMLTVYGLTKDEVSNACREDTSHIIRETCTIIGLPAARAGAAWAMV